MIPLLFNIGFLEIRLLDLLDILLVGILMYQAYRLVKGSLAFNIMIGLLLVFLASLIVRGLDMDLLSNILGQFVGVGVIAVLIVFQPEIRRFLLYLGRGGRASGWFRKFAQTKTRLSARKEAQIREIIKATEELSKNSTGALIIYAVTSHLQSFANTGTHLDARITEKLIESIFFKNNPLHDGAVIIADNKISAAGCVLPVSDNRDLPSHLGLRHRAAVGITEQSDAIAIIVSEETGSISYAVEGNLFNRVSSNDLYLELQERIQD